MLWLAVISLALALPPSGSSFTYHLQRDVRGTGGAYLGWSEHLEADGRYDVVEVTADQITVRARYGWYFESTESSPEAGAEDRTVHIRTDNRRYIDRIDLDELDGDRPQAHAAWFWVPTDLTVGQTVPLLDKMYKVESVDDSYRGAPAVRLVGAGTLQRDDDYGRFNYSWRETFWFDTHTGLVLGSEYHEEDKGRWQGKRAEIFWTERLERRDPDWIGLLDPEERSRRTPVGWFTWALIGLGTVGLGWVLVSRGLLLWRRWPPRAVQHPLLGEVSLTAADAAALGGTWEVPGPLSVFAGDIARRALAAGGRVTLARAGGRVVGIAVRDAHGDVGTALGCEPAIIEALVRHHGEGSWFSDVEIPRCGRDQVYTADAWQVLSLPAPAPLAWDPDLVRPYTLADREVVVRLLETESGERCGAWLDAQLECGDEGFVAQVHGAVVGFGLAGVGGPNADEGRMHGLVVDRAHRGKGIGEQLVRARVATLAALGASRITSEIAQANLPSLHLARKVGFAPVGRLFIQSFHKPGSARLFVRR